MRDNWCSGSEANVCVMVVPCPREECKGSEAEFKQVQIRSADEPMTTFYKVSESEKRCSGMGPLC